MNKLLLITLCFIPTLISAQTADELELITENYAPLNFMKAGKLQGISVDALVEMLKLVGSKKTSQDIKLMPWARGYHQALEKKNTALFAMTRTEEREELFRWVGPIVPSNIVLIAKKNRGFKIHAAEDLGKYKKIGVVRDDVGEQLLLQMGVSKRKIHRTTGPENTVRMLQRDRISMWAYGRIVALWYIKEFGYDPSDYEEIYTLKESAQYYAFHKDTDEKIIAQLQGALDQLKATGELKKIVNKYISHYPE